MKITIFSDCFFEEQKSSIIDIFGYLNLTHPFTSLMMFGLHLLLTRREDRKNTPNEDRPMIICLIVYILFCIILCGLTSMLAMMMSGAGLGLGIAMAVLCTIYQPIIWAIPNVVSYY